MRTCIGTGGKDGAKVVGTLSCILVESEYEGVSWDKRSLVVKCMNLETEVLHSYSDSILEKGLV